MRPQERLYVSSPLLGVNPCDYAFDSKFLGSIWILPDLVQKPNRQNSFSYAHGCHLVARFRVVSWCDYIVRLHAGEINHSFSKLSQSKYTTKADYFYAKRFITNPMINKPICSIWSPKVSHLIFAARYESLQTVSTFHQNIQEIHKGIISIKHVALISVNRMERCNPLLLVQPYNIGFHCLPSHPLSSTTHLNYRAVHTTNPIHHFRMN